MGNPLAWSIDPPKAQDFLNLVPRAHAL